MANAKRRKKFYFLIVATLLLFLIAGVLVVLASLRMTTSALKEPPEIVAKRLDSQNNAWYALLEAVKLLPERPGASMVKDENGWDYKYMPEPDSLGDILKIRRPDNDAALLEYVAESKPATDLALKALEKPWFLHPPEPEAGPQTEDEKMWAFEPQWWTAHDRRAMWQMVRLLQARALIEPCSNQAETDGCLRLIESFRLAGLINQDGIQQGVVNPRLGVNIIRKTQPDHQRRLAGPLSEIRNAYAPGHDLEVRLKSVYGYTVSNILPGDVHPVGRVAISGMLWRQKVFARRHEALLRQAGGMTWKQYEELKAEHTALEKAEDVLPWHSIVPYMPLKNSLFFATADGVSTALALELYKSDTGAYPDSLDELVPKYLPALPENPFTGGPFTYKRVENDYVLSCVQKGKYQYQDGKELVFHAP